MQHFLKSQIVLTFVFFVLILATFTLTPLSDTHAATLPNVLGLQIGSNITQGPISCSWSTSDFSGPVVKTPNITGTDTAYAVREKCKIAPICFPFIGCITPNPWTIDDPTTMNKIKVFNGNTPIPAGTDIRACIQGSLGTKQCTPWASEGGNGWLDSAWSSAKVTNKMIGFRVSIESRAMPAGMSVTDVRFRIRDAGDVSPFAVNMGGTWYGPGWSIFKWAETKWRSAGGGWSDWSTAASWMTAAQLSMDVALKGAPKCTTFTASPTSLISPGGNVVLSWNVTGTSTISISPLIGTSTAVNSKTIAISTTTTFTLTAKNSDGQCQSNTTVLVTKPIPPPLPATSTAPILEVTPSSLRIGDSYTLTWNLNGNNPATCNFTTGSKAPTSSEIGTMTSKIFTAEGVSTYTLECIGGKATASIRIVPKVTES